MYILYFMLLLLVCYKYTSSDSQLLILIPLRFNVHIMKFTFLMQSSMSFGKYSHVTINTIDKQKIFITTQNFLVPLRVSLLPPHISVPITFFFPEMHY